MRLHSSALKIFVILLLLAQPWGNLLRVPHPSLQADIFGLQTLLTVFILIIGVVSGNLLKGIKGYRPFIAYYIFVILGSLVTFVDPYSSHLFLRVLIQNLYYVSLAVVISHIKFTLNELKYGGLIYTFSFSVVSLLSLLEYKHILHIPGFNEAVGSREIQGEYTMRVTNLSGPFSTRTTFGNYCAIAIGSALGSFFMSAIKREKAITAFAFAAIAINFVAALQSLSRGLILSFIAVILYIIYINHASFKQSLRIFVPAIVATSVGGLFLLFSVDYFMIFMNFVNSLRIEEAQNDISSSFRFRVWIENLTSIRVWIMGKGFSPTYIAENYIGRDAHNTFITLFRVLGLPGLILLFISFKKLFRFILKFKVPEALPFICGIISYLAYGLTHTAWNFSVFWIFIGIVINFFINYNFSNHRRF